MKSSDAGYKFKLSQEFQPPRKNVPLLKAFDKKPAGSKLFQGIPGKAKAHDIFNMPKSLGGKDSNQMAFSQAGESAIS